MRYDHMVKINGNYYRAGEETPDANKSKAAKKNSPSYSDSDIEFEELQKPDESKKYTKSEITTMKTADLQELAASVGIEDADKMTGSVLKKLLIDKFEL